MSSPTCSPGVGHDAGAASGLVNAAHQLGGSLGIAILTIAYTRAAGSGVGSADQIAGFRAAFAGADVFFVVALVLGIVVAFFTRARAEPLAEIAAEAGALAAVE